MENQVVEKKAKPKAKQATTVPLRVKVETRKRVLQEVAKANKKDYGKRVRVEDLVALALTLVEPKHIQDLQERSLSNADRLEREYRTYVSQHGPITKDAYLGKRLAGELAVPVRSPDDAEEIA